MNILMVAPEPYFEPRGTPLSVFFRCRALVKLGHKVDLLTYPIGEDLKIKGVNIIRSPNLFFTRKIKIGPSLAKIPLDFVLFVKSVILLSRKKYDCIHVHEESSVFAVLLKKWFKIPLVYDMHSSMPQQLVNYNFSKNSFLIKFFGWLEKKVILNSDAVIVVCCNLEKKAKEEGDEKKIVLIENTSTIETKVKDSEIKNLRKKLKLNDDKVILYAGTFECNQGLDILVKTVPFVIKADKNVKYVFVGGGEKQIERLREIVKKLKVKDFVIFMGQKKPIEIPIFNKLADILVSTRNKGVNTPLKIYSYLKSGKPIVATRINAHTHVLNDDVAVLTKVNKKDFADGIIKILKNPKLGERLSKEARKLAAREYNEGVYLAKVKSVYRMVK